MQKSLENDADWIFYLTVKSHSTNSTSNEKLDNPHSEASSYKSF